LLTLSVIGSTEFQNRIGPYYESLERACGGVPTY
jgi:hypothetical protein